MNANSVPVRRFQIVCAILLFSSSHRIFASDATLTRTNMVERSITNVIEVRIPTNVFVNEYHTNWIQQHRTNRVDLFATNRVMVEALRTNVVNAYRTNWGSLTLTNDVRVDAYTTNFVTAYQTNWKTLVLTNDLAVNAFETNFVTQYRTNSRTLFLTNWETVLVMKTNWVYQPITNVAQIDLPANRSVATEVAAPRQGSEPNGATAPNAAPLPVATLSDELSLEAAATGRSATNQIEVELKVRWTTEPGQSVQVQRWRVERDDGAILSFGQESAFKRMLPPGKYKVEVRARRDARSPVLAARGVLSVSVRDALMRQQLVATH